MVAVTKVRQEAVGAALLPGPSDVSAKDLPATGTEWSSSSHDGRLRPVQFERGLSNILFLY